MSGGFEAAGDAVTGAIIGRAVEPAHGEASGSAHGACLNCGAVLNGTYCSACGQAAHVHRTLKAYGHDLLHSVFHFEGKIWRTLPLLFFKPGELTRRYIHGERARFVSPLALFLFTVFLMFAVVSSLAGEMKAPYNDEVRTNLKGKPLTELDKALAEENARKEQINAAIDKARDANLPTTELKAQRDKVKDEIEAINTARNFLTGTADFTVTELKSGWATLDDKIDKANKNPNLFLYKMQSGAYKYSWALIPMSVPFVWLLFFWRRKFKMYDHAVFVTYSLTFMLLLVVVLTIFGFAGAPQPVVPLAGVFLPPLHIYRQLRGAYGVSRTGGIVRMILLTSFGAVVLIFFMVLLLMLGIMG